MPVGKIQRYDFAERTMLVSHVPPTEDYRPETVVLSTAAVAASGLALTPGDWIVFDIITDERGSAWAVNVSRLPRPNIVRSYVQPRKYRNNVVYPQFRS